MACKKPKTLYTQWNWTYVPDTCIDKEVEELRCGAFDVGARGSKLSFTFCTQDTTQVHHINTPPPLYQYMYQVHMFNSIGCTRFWASYMPLEYSKNDLLFLTYFWQRIWGSSFIAPQDDVRSPSHFYTWCIQVSKAMLRSLVQYGCNFELQEEVEARICTSPATPGGGLGTTWPPQKYETMS